jgi:hypothetical protein
MSTDREEKKMISPPKTDLYASDGAVMMGAPGDNMWPYVAPFFGNS